MTNAVTTRPATEQDDAFLYELFKSVRLPAFAHMPLPPAQLDMLINLQYAGQKQTYRANYPAGDEIVLLDGTPAGRIWIHRSPTEHRLVDIALLPQHRNQGIGAVLVKQAMAAAHAAGLPLCCSVAVVNAGSLRFHQRLGFRIVGRNEVDYQLAAEP